MFMRVFIAFVYASNVASIRVAASEAIERHIRRHTLFGGGT